MPLPRTNQPAAGPGDPAEWLPRGVSVNEQERRIRAALGMTSGALPRVTCDGLQRYAAYLGARLEFPFAARYAGDVLPEGRLNASVEVLGLIELAQTPDPERTGLLCRAQHGAALLALPLSDMEVEGDNPNAARIEDYWYWFWNWRFDPRI